MPDWDEDSSKLASNLERLLHELIASSNRRELPVVDDARRWHRSMMKGLGVADPRFVGSFRGDEGVDEVEVRVASISGTAASQVSDELERFEVKLEGLVAALDVLLPLGAEPDEDSLSAILDVCAWAHAEWIRIHPFANGNGRAARLWANCLAMRYGLPPFVRLRPRPESKYGEVSAKAMRGDWKPTVVVFRELFESFLGL